MTKISVIIPIYNEFIQIPYLIEEIKKFDLKQKPLYSFQYIFVDDGSEDGSFERLKECSVLLNNYKLIKLSRNFGSHAAIRAGAMASDGDFTVYLPADLQVPLDDLNHMIMKLEGGLDVIWVVRDTPDVGKIEKFFSNVYSYMMKRYVNKNIPVEGLETLMFNRKVLQQLNSNVESNSSIGLQILNFGFRFDFIKLKKHARKIGKSKWTISKKVKLLIDSFVAFSYAPIRFVTMMGICFSLAGFFWTIYIIIRTFTIGDLSQGWPALISVLLIGFGISNISLGIIAEYLWRTLDASRKRPVFIVDEIIDFHEI